MQLEQKKTLTEECWVTIGDEVANFQVRIDYPVYPHNATLSRLQMSELVGVIPTEPSWAFYIRTVVKDCKDLLDGEKEFHPKIERGLMAIEDFETLMRTGWAEMIFIEAKKKLDFTAVDKKKL